MNALWLAMLEKAISALVGAFWPKIVKTVEGLMAKNLPGKEKHALALNALREQGSQSATWLLSAGIEIAYGRIVKRLTRSPSSVNGGFRDSGFNDRS